MLVVAMLGLTVVAAGAALGPQVASLADAVGGTPAGDISLAALETRTEMYDRDGQLVHRFSTDGSNRELMTLEDMPEQMVRAVIAIEDQDFLQHKGLNMRAIFRALVENVGAGGISQGGSTITQQLVKNAVLENDEATIERKVQEAVIAWRLEQELSKEEILERYLNTVYFGSGAYGVQAAAEVYFGKQAGELDWPEAALLVALIPNPSRYDPFENPDEARRQRQIVLNRLVVLGEIDQEQARFYNRLPLPTDANALRDLPPEDYYVAEVRRRFLDGELPLNPSQELLDVIGETNESRTEALFAGGLRIYTTYDTDAQVEALKARDGVLPQNERGFTMALAAIEPSTGAVRALVGGPGFETEKFNLATQGDRQPGSSFKTFVLVTALEQNFIPDDRISGVGPCEFDNPLAVDPIYRVTNFNLSTGRIDTLTNQVQRSSNCGFVRLGQIVGIPQVIETATKLGVQLDPVLDNNLSLPLGATEVRPLEMASAYATIANGGVRHDPYYIDRIEDSLGNVLFQHTATGERVLSNQVACLTMAVLEQNVLAGTGTAAQIEDQPAGGKTGTTEKFSDAWFVGFTPQLATSVWMGHPDGRTEMTDVGGRNVTGGSYPAQAWGQFMTPYHEDLERSDFPECAETRPGRLIREDGSLNAGNSSNPCAQYPGWFPTDTTGNGEIDQCIANPANFGYVRCGAIQSETGDVLNRYCPPGTNSGPGSSVSSPTGPPPPPVTTPVVGVQCGAGQVPIDTNFDGIADQCQQATSSACDPGFNPVDRNGDGIADVCVASNQAQQPGNNQLTGTCPPTHPFGRDTNGDLQIDVCYANP